MARRRGKKIDFTKWDGATFTFNAQAAGTAALTMLTSSASTETLLRLRGNLAAWLDGTQTPGRGVIIGVGAIVMPEGQGTTVVSSPLSDDTAPWLFYEQFTLGYEEMVTDVIDVPGITSFWKTIDVKAMRIIRPDREVQLVVENITTIGAATVNIEVAVRALLGT